MEVDKLEAAIMEPHLEDLSEQITDEADGLTAMKEEDGPEATPTKKKKKKERPPPDPSDPAVIAVAAAAHNAIIEAEAAANAALEVDLEPTTFDKFKYYASLGLGTVAIVSAFVFLFLIPFVLDPAISTYVHDFSPEPVTCKISQMRIKHGKTNCKWSSCREGCTATMFKCYQVRVVYTHQRYNANQTVDADIPAREWVDLTRFDLVENKTMQDTPLLVNIKGCGYPPEIACARFYSDYEATLNRTETFPCYFSRVNPWIVLEVYDYDSMLASIIASIVIPNVLFVISLIILLYWYCPYCQAKCQRYEEQIDQDDDGDPELEVDAIDGDSGDKF